MIRYLALLSLVLLFAGASADRSHAQLAEYSGGSIHDLDPAARQATGNRILEQILQSNDMQPVSELSVHDALRKRARPVGRLALQIKGGKVAYCTASVIDKNLIITNHHCVPGQGDVEAAVLWMGYVVPRSRKGVKQYKVNLKPVEASKALDYAILRVNGAPGDEWGKISFSKETPLDGQSLFVVHHPGGFAQHISRGRCQTSAPAIDGDDILHVCDTLGGSSGAPIFDNNTRKVVGLHYSAVGLRDLNAGKRLARIAETSKIISGLLPTALTPQSKDKTNAELDAMRAQLAALQSQLEKQKQTAKPKPDEKKVAVGIYPDLPKKTDITKDFSKGPKLKWKLQSYFSYSSTDVGKETSEFSQSVSDLTKNRFEIDVLERGTVVNSLEVAQAVSDSVLDAAISPAYYIHRDDKTFELFSGNIPSGKLASDVVAWMTDGGGNKLLNERISAAGLEVHALPCQLLGPGGFWSRSPIEKSYDLKGKKMRAIWLAATVFEKMGGDIISLPYSEINYALKSGLIDGSATTIPSFEVYNDFTNAYFYYPSPHQPANLLYLLINKARWQKMSETDKDVIELACKQRLQKAINSIEALASKSLAKLEKKGVKVRKLSKPVEKAFADASQTVWTERASKDASFKEVLDSYLAFQR